MKLTRIIRKWLYPDEVLKIEAKQFIKKIDKTKVSVGPSESMSKSKKHHRPRNYDSSVWC